MADDKQSEKDKKGIEIIKKAGQKAWEKTHPKGESGGKKP